MDNREGQEKSTPPKKIYLQWFGVDKEDLTAEDLQGQPTPGELTWCVDRQFDTDVEYVRSVAGGEGQEKSTPQYRVEKSTEGCSTCSTGATWAIVQDLNGEPCEIGGIAYGNREEAEDVCGMLNDAYELGRALRSVAGGEPEQWISVETKLPEIGAIVLAYRPQIDNIAVAKYSAESDKHRRLIRRDGQWWHQGHQVTHWANLPAPPQGEEQK